MFATPMKVSRDSVHQFHGPNLGEEEEENVFSGDLQRTAWCGIFIIRKN